LFFNLDRTLIKIILGRQRFIFTYNLSGTERSHGRDSRQEAEQELKQKPQRNVAYWFVSFPQRQTERQRDDIILSPAHE